MKREPNSHINERLHTGLAQSGRAAGMTQERSKCCNT